MASHDNESSSFLININALDFTHKLIVPDDFLRHFEGKEHLQFTLKTGSPQRDWIIAATRVEETLFFRQCWSEFVKHHSLEVGDSLHLKYKGRSEFVCRIYDRNGEKKESTAAHLLDDNNESKENVKTDVEKGSRQAKRTKRSARKYMCKTNHLDDSRIGGKQPKLERGEPSRPWQRGEASRSNDKSSRFEATLREYHNRACLYVPSEFARANIPDSKESVLLRDEEGSTYPIKLYRTKRNQLSLGTGWQTFVSKKGLREGDICLFQLENKVSLEIQVTKIGRSSAISCASKRTLSSSTHFKATLKDYNINTPFLYVPSKFGKASIPDSREYVLLKDEEGKTYPVKLIRRTDRNQLSLGAGWQIFVSVNGLREGDTCLFQLEDKVSLEIKVTVEYISRAD